MFSVSKKKKRKKKGNANHIKLIQVRNERYSNVYWGKLHLQHNGKNNANYYKAINELSKRKEIKVSTKIWTDNTNNATP